MHNLLPAFMHWRAKFLRERVLFTQTYREQVDEAFCRTLSMGRVTRWSPGEWARVCYHVFASLILENLPYIILDDQLRCYADHKIGIAPRDKERILLDNCGSAMMNRCFFITVGGLMGMGSGFMLSNDIVCVPLGCKTPIIIRPEGNNGEYRYVGYAYLDGYMYGRAIDEWKDGRRELRKYVLH